MTGPNVSVIVTTRNRCELAQRAVQSVLDQSYRNYDIHIVDDASEDNTRQVMATMAESHQAISYWRHQERRGLPAARNTGFARSEGDYIAFLDDDDVWKPDCLARRVALLNDLRADDRRQLGVIYCGSENRIVGEKRVVYHAPRVLGSIRDYICAHDLYTIPSACLFPRSVLEDIGGYDETLVSSVDHDIWMNLAVHGYHAFAVREPLVVTYDTRARKSMVTDVTPRIQGVEQYLTKWVSTFEDWFGKLEAVSYIRSYRTRVLGSLAARKLCEGDWRAASCLIRHVVSKNGWMPRAIVSLGALVGRRVLSTCIPAHVLGMIKGDSTGTPLREEGQQGTV